LARNTTISKSSLVSAIISPQVGLAVVGFVVFLLTISRPGNLPFFQPMDNKRVMHEEILANSQELLDDLAKMEPSKLAAEGKVDEALAEALKEVKGKPNDIGTLMCAGNVLVSFGDKSEGLKLLNKTLLMMPENRYVRLNYARKLYDSNRKAEAIEQYCLLCKKYPALWTEPHLELANIYIKSDKPNLAAEQYKIILGFNPDDIDMKKRYAFALAAAGNENEGFENFAKACSLKKEEQSYAAVGKALISKYGNDPKKAVSEMKIEVATKSKLVSPRITYTELLLYLRRKDEAKDAAEEAVKVDPQSLEAHALLAEVASQLGDDDLALDEFKNVVKLLKAKHN
jgi:predicted Zn-dependent protease